MSVWNALALRRPFPSFTISRATALSIGASLAFVVVTLVLMDYSHELYWKFYWDLTSWKIYIPFLGATAAALIFVRTRYDEFTGLFKACMRASAVGLFVLLLIEAPDYTLGREGGERALSFVEDMYPYALLVSAAGIFRFSFVVPAVIYLISTRMFVYDISGMPMSQLDIRYMLDMALYMSLFGILAVKVGGRLHPWFAQPERQYEIVGVAMGLHLANYFWSGVAKLAIGPTPWYWAFENKTYNQIPHTIEGGILPIGHIPELSQFAYDTFSIFNVPLNIIIVVVQLFAIVCVLKVNWLKVTSILFDFLHVGIYILGGLFFWPWIWNNLTVYWAARSQQKKGLPLNTKIACIAAIFVGTPALHINPAIDLAWYDLADTRQIFMEAVTKDGRTVKTPSAFFGPHSYSISHAYLGLHDSPGHYKATMLASSDSLERNELSGTCAPPSAFNETPVPDRIVTPEDLGRFLKNHHEKMLNREAAVGRGSWYFHAHHHPSNPFLYEEFNALSLKDVVGYNLVFESVCHSLKGGRVEKKVQHRTTEFYDVR